MAKRGRPPKADIADPVVISRLLERISSGEGILEICEDDDMPSERTVYTKMAADEEFRSRIAHAREMQQEREADICVKMADGATNEDWQAVKLRIWARQWRASKLAPKKYGDKQQVEHSGSINMGLAQRLESARKRETK